MTGTELELSPREGDTSGADERGADLLRFKRAMVAGGLAAAVPYLLILWDIGLNPFRTTLRGGVFSNFYDTQARALLHGHLAVPPGSLGIEAFVERGQHFEYFSIGPALLRIPLFLLTRHFDGRLTAISLLAAWATTMVATALLIWRVRLLIAGPRRLPRWEAAAYALMLTAVGGGSVLVYLGSMPWVYHEEHAWAVATTVCALFCLLGVIENPTRHRVFATGLFTLAAILSRTTHGWACAGAVVLTSMWLARGGRGIAGRRLWWKLALAGALPLAVGVAINWARFRHPYLFPLENQVWTQVDTHRQQALAAHGGGLIGLNVLPSTLAAYLRPDGIRFTSIFPFITLPAHPAPAYAGAFLDQTYRTGSVPDFAPFLFVTGVWGLFTAFRPGGPKGARLLRVLLLTALAIPAATMFYAYIAYRYTTDFLPVLIIAGAVGLVDICRRLGAASHRVRVVAIVGMAGAVAFGVLANSAVGFTTERVANPGQLLRSYVGYQETLSSLVGNPIRQFVSVSAHLPASGPADHLKIIGDCTALYMGTGDSSSPWVEVEAQPVSLIVTVLEGSAVLGADGVVTLAHFVGHSTTAMRLQRSGRDSYRLAFDDGTAIVYGSWFHAAEGTSFPIGIHTDTERNTYTITAADAAPVVTPTAQVDLQWLLLPNVLTMTLPPLATAKDQGLVVQQVPQPAPPLCRRLLSDSR